MGPLDPGIGHHLPKRLSTNRNSAYSPPQWAKGLASGLPGFDTRQCSSGITATLNPKTPNNAAFNERTKKGEAKESQDLFESPEEVRLRRTVRHRRSPLRAAPSRRRSTRSTAAVRPRPTSTRSRTAHP